MTWRWICNPKPNESNLSLPKPLLFDWNLNDPSPLFTWIYVSNLPTIPSVFLSQQISEVMSFHTSERARTSFDPHESICSHNRTGYIAQEQIEMISKAFSHSCPDPLNKKKTISLAFPSLPASSPSPASPAASVVHHTSRRTRMNGRRPRHY